MARFVSRSAAYRVIARGDDYMVLANGQRQQIVKPLVADFHQDVLTNEEVEYGIRNMEHRGLPEHPGTEEDLSPRPRISGFDTVEAQKTLGWTDEERELVETKLREHHMLGIEFLELIPEPTKIPWPTYDGIGSVDEIVKIAVATGTVEQAIAYESENQDRVAVKSALEEALVGADSAVVIEA